MQCLKPSVGEIKGRCCAASHCQAGRHGENEAASSSYFLSDYPVINLCRLKVVSHTVDLSSQTRPTSGTMKRLNKAAFMITTVTITTVATEF